MNCCAAAQTLATKFNRAIADRDRLRYQRRGPEGTTKLILALLDSLELGRFSLLDVGGGIGVIALELIGRHADSATLVEAAPAYLEAARAEATTRGASRISFVEGDLASVADTLPMTDIVTLDRVVCCYPDYRSLLAASAAKCRRVLVMSYPSDRWYVRAINRIQNWRRAKQQSSFRTFIHSPEAMDRLLAESGFGRQTIKTRWGWCVVWYRRQSESTAQPRSTPPAPGTARMRGQP